MVFALLGGPFESAGCTYEVDGWVTTDLQKGERLKWVPSQKKAFRWDVIESQWVPSNETRNEFLKIARQYQASIKQRS
jgi:hypothetical protein